MIFKQFNEPRVFLSSPTDLKVLRENFVKMFHKLREKVIYHKEILPYAWEWEQPRGGYDQGYSVAKQIPLAKGKYCKALVCLFGEKIGTPMLNPEQYVEFLGGFEKEETVNGERLILNWKQGDELKGGFALTGTVFELLTLLAENKSLEKKGMKTIPLKVIFIGDETILSEHPHEANWGNRKLFDQTESEFKQMRQRSKFDEWKNTVYYSQVQQLKNLIGFLMEKGGVQIDTENAIFNDSDEAIKKCEEFLIDRFEYKLNYDKNPFKGLQYYDEEDHDFFLGRDDWVKNATEQFIYHQQNSEYLPFWGIMGGSGVGKSSLLRAGMVANLKISDKFGNYKGVVFTANDLIFSQFNELSAKDFPDTPLGRIVNKSLAEIYKQYESERNEYFLSAGDAEKISRTMKKLNEAETCNRTAQALEYLIAALNAQSVSESEQSTSDQNLVIGLDQFEELLDYWQSEKDNEDLTELFYFFQEACQTRRIGFIYTCQTNREALLKENEQIAPLVRKGRVKQVTALNEDEIKNLTKEKFLRTNIKLDNEIIEELYAHIKEFAFKNEVSLKTSPELTNNISLDEAKMSLLPLFSLTLLRIYEYCQKRRTELEREKSWGSSPSNEKTDSKSETNGTTNKNARLEEENILTLPLEEDLKGILNVETAIADLADRALKELVDSLGLESQDEELAAIFRRLVRIQNALENRYYLLPMSVPTKGFGKKFVETFRKYRLVIPTNAMQVRLVHEAIIQHWSKAIEFIKNEKDLLLASDELSKQISGWSTGKWSRKLISDLIEENDELVVYAGMILNSWWNVFNSRDGYQIVKSDLLLKDFSVEILKVVKTPKRKVKGLKKDTSHFLLGVLYGELELVKDYLKIERSAAKKHKNGRGDNAAYCAVYSENLEMLKLVLEHGANPSEKNKDDWQAVHCAVDMGSLEFVEELISAGVDPTVLGGGKWTCLHTATWSNRSKILRFLLENFEIDINAKDESGWTALHIACWTASKENFNLLITNKKIDTSIQNADEWAPLHLACRYGDADMVERLLRNPLTLPNAETKNGFRAIHLAIYNDSEEIKKKKARHPIEALLNDERIDINAGETLKKTALNTAIENNNLNLVAALVNDPFQRLNPNIVFENDKPPLIKAYETRNIDLVNLLIEAGAEVNGTLRNESALLAAVEIGDIEFFKLFFSRADVFNAETGGVPALLLAAEKGHEKIVEILLKNNFVREYIKTIPPKSEEKNLLHLAVLSGSLPLVKIFNGYFDAKLEDESGSTPLHLAVEKGFVEIARYLLEENTELGGFFDKIGRTFLHIAAANGQVIFFEEFGDGDNLQLKDAYGMRPLHYAIRFKQSDLINYLVEHPLIDLNVQDDYGWTSLHIAAQNGDIEVVKSLLEHGADKSVIGNAPAILPVQAAIEVGHSELFDLLMPEDKTPEEVMELLGEILLAAVKNSHFELASRILSFRFEPTDNKKKLIADAFMRYWHRESGEGNSIAPSLSSLGQLMLENNYPLSIDHHTKSKANNELKLLIENDPAGSPPADENSIKGINIHEYAWTAVKKNKKLAFLEKLRQITAYDLSPNTTKIDACNLSWYAHYELIRVRNSKWNNSKRRLYYLFSPESELLNLDGKSPVIHQVNLKAPIKLNAENILSYVMFFCYFVHGEEGAFYCVESENDPCIAELLKTVKPEELKKNTAERIKAAVIPFRLEWLHSLGNYLCNGIIIYSNVLYKVNMSIQPGGMVEMLEDEAIVEDLPIRMEVFIT